MTRVRLRLEKPRALLRQAIDCQAAGHQAAADRLFRQVLLAEPTNAEALHALGLSEHEQGRHEAALHWLERAVGARPEVARFHSHVGAVKTALGRFGEAVRDFQTALRLDPALSRGHYNLAVALQRCGRLGEAVQQYRAELELAPSPSVYNNLGSALHQLGRRTEAIAAFAQAVRLEPRFVDALLNLGHAFHLDGREEDALGCYERILLFPDAPFEKLRHAGAALVELGQPARAAVAYRKALACRRDPGVCNSLGVLLCRLGEFEEGMRLLHEAAALRPRDPAVRSNLGLCYLDQGSYEQAIASLEEAIALQPDYAPARYNRSLAWLASGRMPEGWHEYEWRHRCPSTNSPLPDYPAPRWRGEDLNGRTILVYAEQGIGDTLQFVRYVPLLGQRGASVILLCSGKLHRLLAGCEGIQQLLAPGSPLPRFDFHSPLMGLPAAFGTTLETIPSNVPYLRFPGWRMTGLDPAAQRARLRVGFAWAGSPRHPKDRFRSVALERFQPLLVTPGVQFLSLQAGPRAADLKKLPGGLDLQDIGSHVADLADTAHAMAQLDLVISVDTAVAHLAGALGLKVWLLVPSPPDWRWLLERDDSPWYPGMRLFRQPDRDNWAPVFARVKECLELEAART